MTPTPRTAALEGVLRVGVCIAAILCGVSWRSATVGAEGSPAPGAATTRAGGPASGTGREPNVPPPRSAGSRPTDIARQLYLVARLKMSRGAIDEARLLLEEALEFTPTWAQAKLALARCLRISGRPASERAAPLGEALSVDPNNHETLYELGLVAEETGRPDTAIERYQAALGLRPDMQHAGGRLAALLVQRERWAEALPLLERTATDAPEDPVACSLLAVVLEGLGRTAEAERVLRRLVSFDTPPQPHMLRRLAAFYERRGDAAAQQRTLRRLERVQPDPATRRRLRPLRPSRR